MDYGLVQSMIKNKGYNHYDIKVGQLLEIHEKMGEWDNQRIWKFKGLVIAVNKPNNHDGSFTVIGESSGVKIEKTYPLSFGKFDKIILLDEGKVRKSKLYYQKTKVGKDARMKSIIKKENRWLEIVPKRTEIVEEEKINNVEEIKEDITPTTHEVQNNEETIEQVMHSEETVDTNDTQDTHPSSEEILEDKAE